MFECFHCGEKAVIWDCDYDAEDSKYTEPGMLQVMHCSHCGAVINYYIKTKRKEEEDGPDDSDE